MYHEGREQRGIVYRRQYMVKRPGTNGIPAEQYKDVFGKIAARDIAADEQVTAAMIGR